VHYNKDRTALTRAPASFFPCFRIPLRPALGNQYGACHLTRPTPPLLSPSRSARVTSWWSYPPRSCGACPAPVVAGSTAPLRPCPGAPRRAPAHAAAPRERACHTRQGVAAGGRCRGDPEGRSRRRRRKMPFVFPIRIRFPSLPPITLITL